jgi:hypothetical protein
MLVIFYWVGRGSLIGVLFMMKKKNTYTFSIKGKHIVLALVREKMETKVDSGRTCCLHHNLWRK